MAYTSQEIVDFLLRNPGMTDEQIVKAMETYGVSPAQMAQAVGLSEGAVGARIAATVSPGQSVTLGDTVIVPQYRTTGSGETQEIGALEGFATSKTTGDPNYKAPVGTPMQIYSADGEFVNTVKTKKDQSFFGGLVDAFKDPVVLAALGGAAAGGLFGGAGALGGGATAATGATALTAAEAAGLGLTAAEAASLGLSASEFAAAGGLGAGFTAAGLPSGAGTFLGEGVLSGVPAFDAALANATVGATGLTAAQIAQLNTSVGGTSGLLTPAGVTSTAAGTAASTIPAATAATTAATALTPTAASVLAPAAASALTPTVANIATSLIPTAVKSLFTPTNIGNLVTSGAQTAAGLLQQQTSREAAQKAQQMIDAETAAAKQSAAFRPIGMTTRFGTSQFQVDPVTGQLTSAGYTLSPEAKNAQDRLVKLAESGLQQAEGAQQAFAPLQTGAQSLFGLGNKYLAQNPQDVAQNYLNQQMQLLQPGRELELANLQNRLQQQGRGGLSVAQGGTLGATTPELQALFNARAQQEAQLGANAQQYGQQQVTFGAGLLNQGAQTMGQYYGGQQAAYSPYTTALGQVQGLEAAAQQPLTLGASLGQTAAAAGAKAGEAGLYGARLSTALATSPAATTNPYSTALSGVASSPVFGQVVGGLFGNQPATSGFSYGQYGTGVDPSTGEYFGSLYF
jgi:hypothetical protein